MEEESVWAKEVRERKKRNPGAASSSAVDDLDLDVEDEEQKVRDSIMQLELGDLDITNEEIDFSEVDDDLLKFQRDDLVKDALDKGVDLRNYARQIDEELHQAENACVQDYIQDADSLASLHSQIGQCDGILSRMENLLSRFQGDLGAISSEIKQLQDKSVSMDVKLKNRKVAEQRLSSFINSIMVPPELITQISEADVNESYVEALATLNNKIHVLQLRDIRDAQAARDVRPTVDTLRLKVRAMSVAEEAEWVPHVP